MLPTKTESPPPQQFSFSGSELFQFDQALSLEKIIQNLLTQQPKRVITICEGDHIGWTSSGYGDTKSVSAVEQSVKMFGCMELAIETSKILGVTIDKEKLVTVVLNTRGFNYRDIPEAVFKLTQENTLK